MDGSVKVSIICNTYNHGPYIRDAMEGFLMQQTSFEYEILIHDDASTDETPQIIREYENKYPGIVKPIYQVDNQYSNGVNITKEYNLPRAKGKYLAFCEGDDFWSDPLKLEKQFQAMEKHPTIDICSHGAKKVCASNGRILEQISPSKEVKIFDVEDVILGGGGFVATNSLFIRRSLFDNQPSFYKCYSFDYSLQIFGSMRGGMLYIPDIMAVYRAMVPGSWSVRMRQKQYTDVQRTKIKSMLDCLDIELDGDYAEAIQTAKLKVDFSSLELAGNYKELRKGELSKLYKEMPLEWKIKTYLKEYFPFLLKLYRK